MKTILIKMQKNTTLIWYGGPAQRTLIRIVKVTTALLMENAIS